MADIRIVTTSGTFTSIDESRIQSFASKLRGDILLPDHPQYDVARRIWNASIDRYPGIIVQCASAADVIDCVRFARDNSLLISVRSGGHNVAGNAISEGGLMIDLSRMKSLRVEPRKRIARAEPGLILREFDRETQAFGLATTLGVISTTGITGLTLGGGMGWLMRKHGLACDNLISADVVTADGRLLHASKKENPDLYWGLRGGGGNFGIVTSLEYRLHPVPELIGGMLIYPFDKASEILKFVVQFAHEAPDALAMMPVLVTGPDGSPVAAVALCYNGPLRKAQKTIKPLRKFMTPLVDQVGPISYVDMQRILDAGFPSGLRNYWKSSFLKELNGDAIDVMVASFQKVPSRFSGLAIEQMGGAVSKVGLDETAFSARHSEFNYLVAGIWENAAEDEINRSWARQAWSDMQPWAEAGGYINYLGQEADEGSDRVKASYGGNYTRLAELKRKYDPENFFRMNQNIHPS
jgi:FAD/FMN-containing dehydrogenase